MDFPIPLVAALSIARMMLELNMLLRNFQHPYTRHNHNENSSLICNTNNEFIQVDSVQPLTNVCINNIATTFLST